MPDSRVEFDLIGVGAPIMDLVATVPESFLAHAGEKGGSVNISPDEISQLIGLLPKPPTPMPGGSAATPFAAGPPGRSIFARQQNLSLSSFS